MFDFINIIKKEAVIPPLLLLCQCVFYGCDEFRCGAAATAQECCAIVSAACYDRREFFGGLGVEGNTISTDGRNTGIRFADQRALYIAAEFADQIRSHHVSSDAVETHRYSAGFLQLPQDGTGITTGEKRTVRLHGECIKNAVCAFQLGGSKNGFCFQRVQQCLGSQQIGTTFQQAANLTAIVIHQQIKTVLIPTVAEGSQSGQVAGNETIGGGRARKSHQICIDFFAFTGQAHFVQGDGLGLEGGSVDDIGTCGGISLLQVDQSIGMIQYPLFGAAALGHTGFLEIGTGGTVQKQGAVGDFLTEFFFGEHKTTPNQFLV